MIQKILTYLQFGNRFCGIEHASQNGQEFIHGTLLKKTKKSADVELDFEASNIDKLIKQLPKQQHVYLIINNDNVLTKSIESNPKEDIDIVYKAFPNINIDDFFYEIISKNNTHFISICRKDYIMHLLDIYKSKKIAIVNISLGNLLVSSISSFIKKEVIFTTNATITTNLEDIISIKKTGNPEICNYNINGLDTNNTGLLSISGALVSILNHFESQSNLKLLKKELVTNFKQSRFFSQFIKFGLVFFLSLLLFNFFAFNHYFSKVGELQQTSQVNQTTKDRVLELNEIISKKQKLVDDVLKSNASKSSFYVNMIVKSIPNTIQLSELNYHPLLKRIKEGEIVKTESNTIFVSGESSNSSLFSKWITDLETNNLIDNIETSDYSNISKVNSSFSIIIKINNE